MIKISTLYSEWVPLREIVTRNSILSIRFRVDDDREDDDYDDDYDYENGGCDDDEDDDDDNDVT